MISCRLLKDKIAAKSMLLITALFCLFIFIIFLGLYLKSRGILSTKPLTELLFTSAWKPLKGQFGLLPFIAGTFWVTAIAVIMAIPLCVLASIYIAEYASSKFRAYAGSVIDLLAGIPSVVFGIWGVLAVVPFVKNVIAPLFGVSTSGYNVLSGGIVLAIMIFPIIINLSVEIIRSVPKQMREASLALGATKWQTIKYVVMRKALPGITAAVILGFSRALGETMAVLMVVGNVASIPRSVFDPAYPLPALIANNYGEMLSIPLYDSAIMLVSLLLLMIVVFFNVLARFFLITIQKRSA